MPSSNKPPEQFQQTSRRAGVYRRQPAGYWAFIPAGLHLDTPIELTPDTQQLLALADRAVARLDGASSILPNPELFVFMYVRKEAVLSSQIEGTQASLSDVVEFEADRAAAIDAGDVPEVLNYVRAMNQGLDRLVSLPLSTRLLCEIHEPLLAGVRGQNKQPGEIRSSQNWIGPEGLRDLNEASYVPPPPDEARIALDNLQKFIHQTTEFPLLVKIALVHAQFETIHPFLDGNGRVGRLLITFMLCWRGVLERPLLYLSHYFKAKRPQYYDHLQRIRLHGQFEPWIEFFLQGVYEVAKQATETAKAITALRERDRTRLVSVLNKGAATGLAVFEELFKLPVISVNQAARIGGVTYAPANALIAKLESLGILQEITGRGRNRLFMYGEYFRLLQDEPAVAAEAGAESGSINNA